MKTICEIMTLKNGKAVLINAENYGPQDQKVIRAINANLRAFEALYKSGELATASEYMTEYTEGDDTTVYFVVDADKLDQAMLEAQFPENDIFQEEFTPCIFSGCISVVGNMRTYRDNCGCVSKSWEIPVVQYLSNPSRVAEVRDTQGPAAAGIEAIKTLLAA